MLKKSIRYVVLTDATVERSLSVLYEEMQYLDQTPETETTFLIFPNHYADFQEYLDLVEMAENLVADQDYEGIYQVASFHPEYCFEDADADDPANYTNRSIYPMLHLLREDSISDALDNFPDAEGIPERNIAFSKRKGLAFMKQLREACLEV